MDEDEVAVGEGCGRYADGFDYEHDFSGEAVGQARYAGETGRPCTAAGGEVVPELRHLVGAPAAVMFIDYDPKSVGGHGCEEVGAVGEHGEDNVAGVVELGIVDIDGGDDRNAGGVEVFAVVGIEPEGGRGRRQLEGGGQGCRGIVQLPVGAVAGRVQGADGVVVFAAGGDAGVCVGGGGEAVLHQRAPVGQRIPPDLQLVGDGAGHGIPAQLDGGVCGLGCQRGRGCERCGRG